MLVRGCVVHQTLNPGQGLYSLLAAPQFSVIRWPQFAPDGMCCDGLRRYYDDAACVLRTMFLEAKAPHLSSKLPPRLPWSSESYLEDGISRQGSVISGTFGQAEELRCVIAVLRQ